MAERDGDDRGRDPAEPVAEQDPGGTPAPGERSGLDRLRGSAAGEVVDRIAAAAGGAGRSWSERPGARVRQIRRLGRSPIPSLPARYPESRNARPVQVGLRSIPVSEIGGTAGGGGDQRGGDFLPLKPFRGANWKARWTRLRAANDRLESLPTVEVVRYSSTA